MVLKGGYDKAKENEPEYEKRCTNCGLLKDKEEFDINQVQAGDRLVRRGQCKDCRKYKKPISQKKREEYEKIHPKPKIGEFFHCPICNKKKPVLNAASVALDHDHNTGEIRGYICLACNTGMGQLRDNVRILNRAILWIQRKLLSFF